MKEREKKEGEKKGEREKDRSWFVAVFIALSREDARWCCLDLSSATFLSKQT